ncbi:MAG: aminopeptidase [Xanthomonadales bacterium]
MRAYSTVLLTGLASLALAGCASPAYFAQAAAGQFELMRQRTPIEDLLADRDTDPELAARLRTATAARRFAIDELGLPDTDSYTRFVQTGRAAVTWNVIAAPEFSLEPRTWCFPVAGCVPYRGYFDPADADRFAASQRRGGYDVTISPALAYSTLGWFEDPLLDTMLRYSDAQLAATLFHEMAHARLYVRGDAAFNEAFAGFVGTRGLERWLTARDASERLERWRRIQRASRDFEALLERARSELDAVYRSGAAEERMRAEKDAAFDRLRRRYRALVDREWSGVDHFASWFSNGPNNASLALSRTYAGGHCAFGELFTEAGGDFRRFYRLAESRAALEPEARRDWLQQPCPAIASTDDL